MEQQHIEICCNAIIVNVVRIRLKVHRQFVGRIGGVGGRVRSGRIGGKFLRTCKKT